jgi:anti-sigma-K factor RskA
VIDEALQDQATLYVLGMLNDAEAAEFRAAAARDPELQALVDEITESAAALARALPPKQPPVNSLPRLLAELRAERTPVVAPAAAAPGINWLPWALAAVFTLAAGLLFFRSFEARQQLALLEKEKAVLAEANAALTAAKEALAAENAALVETRDRLTGQIATLTGQIRDLQSRDNLAQLKIAALTSQVQAYAKVVAVAAWDSGRQEGLVRFSNLPPPAAGKDYQMWVIDPKYPAPVSAGVFEAGRGGALNLTFKAEKPIASADKFAVSVERKGGSPTPQGQIVLISN